MDLGLVRLNVHCFQFMWTIRAFVVKKRSILLCTKTGLFMFNASSHFLKIGVMFTLRHHFLILFDNSKSFHQRNRLRSLLPKRWIRRKLASFTVQTNKSMSMMNIFDIFNFLAPLWKNPWSWRYFPDIARFSHPWTYK